ncbi:MAG: glutaredoxin family protein [Methylotenera sp.]|jgi:hypothetical protein|nr:glutaredoxin family protein [Methylotenera sp.]MDZ4142321.1 glutaredoxin family protein [Methylotenera sp.]
MSIALNLYSTSHCHLCEQAESLLHTLANNGDILWTKVEISDDATLLKLYELKIPVLKRLDNNREINWPFSLGDIANFIK